LLIMCLFFETGSHYIAKAGPELMILSLPSPGIIGECHHSKKKNLDSKVCFLIQ
jgi:hypothetical protein